MGELAANPCPCTHYTSYHTCNLATPAPPACIIPMIHRLGNHPFQGG